MTINALNHAPVEVPDWHSAHNHLMSMDRTVLEDEESRPLDGTVALCILAEFGAIAHTCASAPEDAKLAVYVWPPTITFVPSKDGRDGVFIQPYDEAVHGPGAVYEVGMRLLDWDNISARCHGWWFFGRMCSLGMEAKDGE